MPSLPVNTSVSVSLPAGSSINITGNGAWAFIATVSGREIASGSYVGPDVIGPFARAAVVGLTATVSDGLQYTVQDFVEGNSAAAALTTEQVTALQSVVSEYGNNPKLRSRGWFNMPAATRDAIGTAPTVAVSAAHGITSGTLVPFTPNGATRFMSAAGGAAWSVINSIYWTPGQTNPGTATREPSSLQFGFNGLVCAPQITSAPGNYYRISVAEGQGEFKAVTAWESAAGPGGGAIRYIVITFATAIDRRIRIDFTYADIAGVVVGPNDSIWAPPLRGPNALFIGDSFMGGAGVGPVGYNGISSWVWTYAQEMGWDRVTNAGVGGQKSTDVTSRIPAIMAASTWDYVHIGYGKNDNPSNSAAAYAAAMAANCAAIKAAAPNCVLVVDGPNFPGAPVNRTADATWSPYQTALFEAVAPYADLMLDTVNSAIFTGTGKAGTTTGSGNGDLFIQSDGAHPNQAGSDYMGRRKAAQVRALLSV